ncbi:MAG: ATP-binding protein [Christensenellaceae bacterium]|nr:ATP-binding protein [Christensenellaceae bacterium]
MKRIVLSGGPCSGKTSALETVGEYFAEKGLKVGTVPETATELINEGLCPMGETAVAFHVELIKRQILKEDALSALDLIICDRGAVDIKAYLTDGEFQEVLAAAGYAEDELRSRYFAVYHMVTAAIGAEEAYSLDNNGARSETLEYAREVEARTRKVWEGHTRYHVIDNSTDFDGKTKRLIEAIESDLK